jgi:hypothetical protein
MSFAGIRFSLDESLLNDKELADMYRNRDNDEYYQCHKALTISKHSSLISEDGKAHLNIPLYNMSLFKPTDKVWLSMTDEERIENGLMSNYFYKYFLSPAAYLGICIFNSKFV